MLILNATGLTKTYTLGNRQIRVLDNVSIDVPEGEFLVVSGSSGSGKSTLLSVLSGLDRPTAGRVILEGIDITDAKEDDLAHIRNQRIGFVFQSFHLVPSMSALENVMFPAELKKDAEARDRATSLLERLGLAERAGHFPHQLSGGEQQRVAMGRALINRPRIIFADEPTGNLDSEAGRTIMDLLLEFHRELGTTLVLVTHNLNIAALADRRLTLIDGRIREGG